MARHLFSTFPCQRSYPRSWLYLRNHCGVVTTTAAILTWGYNSCASCKEIEIFKKDMILRYKVHIKRFKSGSPFISRTTVIPRPLCQHLIAFKISYYNIWFMLWKNKEIVYYLIMPLILPHLLNSQKRIKIFDLGAQLM